jgi:hypothetical protein
VGRISLVGLIGLDSIIGLVGQTGLVGLIGYNGLVDRIIQNGLVDRNNLVGPIGFSDISGLIDRISLVGPIGFSGVIGLVGQISLGISLVSLISLVGQIGFGFVRLISLGDLSVISLISFVIAAKTISPRLKQAAALVVATLQSSATEIGDVAFYYFASSSLHVCLLVREKMLCWWLALARKKMWWWLASFGKSYNGDVLQLAEQIFSLSLPQMTKYCVMRECENIHSWISLVGDLVFSHQGEIYGFKFPKRFFGDLFQRSHSFDSFLNLII